MNEHRKTKDILQEITEIEKWQKIIALQAPRGLGK